MSIQPMRSVEVFYSYAPEDKPFLDKLKPYLNTEWWQSKTTRWDDENVPYGIEKKREIQTFLNKAHIILLFISPNFLNSKIHTEQMKQAAYRHNTRNAHAIYILLRPVDILDLPYKFDILPLNNTPIIKWGSIDDALLQIERWIRREVDYWYEHFHQSALTPSDIVQKVGNGKEEQMKVSEQTIDIFKELTHKQKKVDELKKMHNKLHGLEASLSLLTDEYFIPYRRIGKKLDIGKVEKTWIIISEKVEDIQYFTLNEVEFSDEALHISLRNRSSESKLLTSLLDFKDAFQSCLDEQSVQEMDSVSQDLLHICRSYLHKIDGDLLAAINQVDQFLDRFLRSIGYDSADNI